MKKKLIIILSIIIVITLIVGSIILYMIKNGPRKYAKVYSVDSIIQESGEMEENMGMVTNNVAQNIYLEEERSVGQVFVEEGQKVKEGDKIFSYDIEEAKLELEIKELELQNAKDQLESDNRELIKLKNTTPVADEPTEEPTETPIEEPTEEPTQEPVEEMQPKEGEAYNILDTKAKAFEGNGAEKTPYRYLCTDKAYITGELINLLAGYNKEGTKKKGDPKTAIFEVHKGNKEKGKIIYSWTFVGKNNKPVDPAVKWNVKGYEIDEESTEEEPVDDTQEETVDDTDNSETEEENTSDDTVEYDSQTLKAEIEETEQKIKDDQVEVKEAELKYKEAKKKVDEAEVTSKINGIVKKINGENSNNEPYIVIAGSEGLYIKGYINELQLNEVKTGQKVIATNLETMDNFEAVIKEIAKYPASSENTGFGSGNPNSSYYPYIAYVDNADGLNNGDYLSLKFEKGPDSEASIEIPAPMVRNSGSNYYVYVADKNNRLKKKSVKISAINTEMGSIEVESGLTMEDRIAFPYGPTAKEGMKVKDAEFNMEMEE